MKETAINSVYVLMHCIGENMVELNKNVLAKTGYIWEVYFRKDEAEKEAYRLNINNNTSKRKLFWHKYIVIEKVIY